MEDAVIDCINKTNSIDELRRYEKIINMDIENWKNDVKEAENDIIIRNRISRQAKNLNLTYKGYVKDQSLHLLKVRESYINRLIELSSEFL